MLFAIPTFGSIVWVSVLKMFIAQKINRLLLASILGAWVPPVIAIMIMRHFVTKKLPGLFVDRKSASIDKSSGSTLSAMGGMLSRAPSVGSSRSIVQ